MSSLFKDPVGLMYVVVAAAGGLAKYMVIYLQDGKFNFFHLLAHMCIAIFSGYMFANFAGVLGVEAAFHSLFAGLGGFMGVKALELIENNITRRGGSNGK